MKTLICKTIMCILCILVSVGLWPTLSNAAPNDSDLHTLDGWINTELLPFLANRLGRHPRLKGQPFEIISVNKAAAAGKTDGLSAYIRQRIIDRLQETAGVNLVFGHGARSRNTTNILADVACQYSDRVTAQVIIELDDGWVGGELRVAVQAIDLSDNQWIQGFKKVWVGVPNAREKQLLAKQVKDRYQAGSRGSPFKSNQPDLLASYLVENLSCQLKNTGETSLRLALSKISDRVPRFFHTTFELLHHYLARFQEIEITEKKFANISVTLNTHVIEPKLFQATVRLHSTQNTIRIVGVGAEAYVLLDTQPPLPNRRQKTAVIEFFQLVTPKNKSHCSRKNPWRNGTTQINQSSRLSHNDCFALRFKAAQTADLYLFAQTDDDATVRLFPNSCNRLGLQREIPKNRLRASQIIHAPLSETGRQMFFRLDRNAGTERVYAVAVTDATLSRNLRSRIESLGDICVNKRNAKSKTANFRNLLNELAQDSQGLLEWRERSFVHIR